LGNLMDQTSYPLPIWSISLDNRDISSSIEPRLISLSIAECREGDADQLTICLSDEDGKLEIPKRGVTIRAKLGWKETGLVDKGTFKVDEVEYAGTPDTITLRARSIDLKSALRTRTDRSFHKTTVAAIVEAIAKAHGLKPVVGLFGKDKVQHIDQTNESDMAFLARLGKRYDAVATVKDGRLLFLPIARGETASGDNTPIITIDRKDGDRFRYHSADRDSFTGVRAIWVDTKRARHHSVVYGAVGNAKKLKTLFGNKEDALANAKAEWARIQRGVASFEMDLAYGRPDLTPQYRVQLPTFKTPASDHPWLLARTVHTLDQQGLVTHFEAESDVVAEEEKVVSDDETGGDDDDTGDGEE
jgi:phage protein D